MIKYSPPGLGGLGKSGTNNNANSSIPEKSIPAQRPIEIFRVRCWARSQLYAAGDLDLIEAVDVLQTAAVTDGLVNEIGEDAVQAIMAVAFGGTE